MLSSLELKMLAGYISDNIELQIEQSIERILQRSQTKRISQRKAQQLYGRTKLENWRVEGKIRRFKIGNRFEYEVKELERLNKQPLIKVR